MTPLEPLQAQPQAPTVHETIADAQRPLANDDSRASVVWRRKWIIMLIAIAAAAATYVISDQITPKYQASATVQVSLLGGAASSEGVVAANDLASQYAQIVDSEPVVQAVARRLKEPTAAFRADLSGGTVNDQNLIAVRATAESPREAGRRATAAADELAKYVTRTTVAQTNSLNAEALDQLKPLDRQIRALRSQLAKDSDIQSRSMQSVARQQSVATLEAQRAATIGDIARAGAAGRPSLQVLNPAGDGSKVEPKPALYTAVAFFLTLLIAAQLMSFFRPRRSV
jgi:capsular polysaccharide biosynthesis protein